MSRGVWFKEPDVSFFCVKKLIHIPYVVVGVYKFHRVSISEMLTQKTSSYLHSIEKNPLQYRAYFIENIC